MTHTEKTARILIAGAGGVGGYFGGRLAQHGFDTTFLARGAHLAALQNQGLTLHSIDGDAHIRVAAFERLDGLAPFDVIFVSVKHHDLPATLETLAPVVHPGTLFVPLLNGVTATPTIQTRFPEATVLGGIAFIGSRIEAPGTIAHTAAGSLTLGAWPQGEGGAAQVWIDHLKGAGIDAHLARDIQKAAWKKMVWNCGFNAFTALTGQWVFEVLASPEQTATVRGAMLETIAVARAAGIELGDELAERTLDATQKGGGRVKTSMLQDVEAGRPLELGAMNRHVVELGRLHGVPTPIHQTLCALLAPLERGV